MPAYMISLVDVTDMDQYQEYVKRAPGAHQKFGAKVLARGGRSLALEGEAPPGRVVILEFENLEQVEAFYNSPEYQDAKKHREGAAEFRMMAVEGA